VMQILSGLFVASAMFRNLKNTLFVVVVFGGLV